jgi:hypothetical protein
MYNYVINLITMAKKKIIKDEEEAQEEAQVLAELDPSLPESKQRHLRT